MRLALFFALAVTGCATAPPVAQNPDAAPDTTASEAPPRIGPVFAGPMRADPIYDVATLVTAIHARYAETWYETLSSTQQTHRRRADGSVATETWREWAAVPGRLRIEMGDPLAGPDVLFVGDTTYVYRDGELAAARAERNPLLLWGFDVYRQDPAETLRILESEGMDLEAFRTDGLDGRQMYVLGMPETGEVWVEQDRLLFARLVEPAQGGGLHDVRFENYQRLGGGWIAPCVAVFQGDQLVFWETYSDIEADPDIDPVLFDPRQWAEGVAAIDRR